MCSFHVVEYGELKGRNQTIPSYAGHLFHLEKYTLAFCTSVADVLA